MKTNNRLLYACGSIFGIILLLLDISSTCADSIPSACDFDSSAQAGFCASSNAGGIDVAGWHKKNQQSPGRQASQDSSSVNSQRSLQTAEGSASSDAQGAGTRYVCDGVTREYSLPDGTAKMLGCLFSSARSGDDTAGVVEPVNFSVYGG